MLHNTGAYSPNEVPVNMNSSAPSTSSAVTNSKMGQPGVSGDAGHFNLPDYTHYGHLNQASPFHNFHSLPYQNYTQNSVHDAWQNVPMNLNIQNDYRKSEYSNNPMSRAPLNSPVYTKAFHKQMGLSNMNNFPVYNPSPGVSPSFRSYFDNSTATMPRDTLSDLDKTKLKDQDSRRRSLENTVRMIENILINSTSKKNDNHTAVKMDSPKQTVDKIKDISNHTDNETCNDDNEDSDTPKESVIYENITINIEKITEKNKSDSDESDASCEETLATIKIEKDVLEPNIEVKVEPMPDCMEGENPFHRDIHGVMYDQITNSHIIDASISIRKAIEVMNYVSESTTDSYFECPTCNMFFNHPKRFLIHTKWHTFGVSYENRMEMVKEKEGRRKRKDAMTFTCKECNKQFTGRSTLKAHMKGCQATSLRTCKICGEQTYGWPAMRVHVRDAHGSGGGGFECSQCPKRFKFAHSLAKHSDTHKEKTHACTQCPKMFGSAALLNTHMKTHERAQRGATYRCTYCGKGFFESYNLQVHERTHRNERPFLCEICNTSFGTNSSLKRHLKVSHSTSKPFVCSTCHRSFVSEMIRDRHEQRMHGNPEDFKFICKQCPCRYMKAKDLRKHTYKAHPKTKKREKEKSESE